MAASYSASQLASLLLAHLGAPDNAGTNAAAQAWIRHESGSEIRGNNPLNIHYDVALSYGIKPDGKWYSKSDQAYVASFNTIDGGMAATAKILNTNVHGYRAASDALRANNPVGFLNAVAASDWSTSHYGAKVNTTTHTIVGGTNGLISQFNSILGGRSSGGSYANTQPDIHGDKQPLLSDWDGYSLNAPAFLTAFLTPLIGKKTWIQAFPSDGSVNPGIYNSVSNAISKAGVDPNSQITADDIKKVTDYLTANPPRPGIDNTTGLGEQAGQAIDTAAGAASVLGYITDPAHWLYIFGLAVGVGLTGYGIIVLVRGYGGPTVVAPLAKGESK